MLKLLIILLVIFVQISNIVQIILEKNHPKEIQFWIFKYINISLGEIILFTKKITLRMWPISLRYASLSFLKTAWSPPLSGWHLRAVFLNAFSITFLSGAKQHCSFTPSTEQSSENLVSERILKSWWRIYLIIFNI